MARTYQQNKEADLRNKNLYNDQLNLKGENRLLLTDTEKQLVYILSNPPYNFGTRVIAQTLRRNKTVISDYLTVLRRQNTATQNTATQNN